MVGNEILHETSNDNVITAVNFAKSKKKIVRSIMFLLKTFMGPLLIGKLIAHILIDMSWQSFILDMRL